MCAAKKYESVIDLCQRVEDCRRRRQGRRFGAARRFLEAHRLLDVEDDLADCEFKLMRTVANVTEADIAAAYQIAADALGANEIAFLSVIANEQPNPGVNGIADTICYGDVATLNEKMHLSHVDVRSGYGKIHYSNVYRISLKTIRAFFDAEDDTL